jgi:membrane-bound lytic murein transglycosylase B
MKNKICIAFFCLSVLFPLFVSGNALAKRTKEKLSEEDRAFLVSLFKESGFDDAYLKSVFKNKRIRFMPGLVKQNVVNIENPFNYKQFLEPAAISRAKKFSRKWRTRLKNAEEKHGVDKEIIAAICLVESGFGRYKGSDSVISVFSSILLEDQGKRKEKILKSFKTTEEKEKYLKRLKKKAGWAKGELRALLEMKEKFKVNIFKLKGSYAGAFGIPQFLPSSYLHWACSADDGARPNLDYVPDVIVSVSNYLMAHGWKKGQPKEKNREAIWAYNHSKVYVETILEIADKLKED